MIQHFTNCVKRKEREKMNSSKSKVVALVLCIFGGFLGLHRFYVGKKISGILYLLTGGVFGIGWIYDIFEIIGNRFTDSAGLPIATGAVSTKPAFKKWQFWVTLIIFFSVALNTSNTDKTKHTPIDNNIEIKSTIDNAKTDSSTIPDISESNSKFESETISDVMSEASESSEFEVEIEVNGQRKDNGVVFNVTTNLPDTAELLLSLTNGDGNGVNPSFSMAQDKITIKEGKAASTPFSNKGSPLNGDFDLCISMGIPSLQTDEVPKVIGENGENIKGNFVQKSTIDDSNVVEALFSVSLSDEIVIKEEQDYSFTKYSSESASENTLSSKSSEEKNVQSTTSHEKYEVSATPATYEYVFIINTDSNIVHKSTCAKGQEVLSDHRLELTVQATSQYEAIQYVISQGYSPCGICMK